MDWVFDENEEGLLFLKSVHESENMDIFSNQFIMTIITYFYQQIKYKVMMITVPMYLATLASMHYSFYLKETRDQQMYLDNPGVMPEISMGAFVMAVFNSFMAWGSVGLNIRVRPSYVTTFWQILIAVITTLVSMGQCDSCMVDVKMLRYLEVLVLIHIYNLGYFHLKLVDEIAPLVAII